MDRGGRGSTLGAARLRPYEEIRALCRLAAAGAGGFLDTLLPRETVEGS